MKFQMFPLLKTELRQKFYHTFFLWLALLYFVEKKASAKTLWHFHLISQSCEVNSGFKARGAIPVRVTSAFFFHYFC